MWEKFLFILNPSSGADQDRNLIIKDLKKEMKNMHLEVFNISREHGSEKILEIASGHSWDGILIGGGDGSINMVADAVKDLDIPLGIVPLGSANGLAACLGISSVTDTIEAVKQQRVRSIDVLTINGRLCLHLADFGFNAALVKKFEQGNERGMIAYVKNSFGEFLQSKPYFFELQIDENHHAIEAKMLVIANGDRYGTQALINPDSAIDDGLFEIVAINPVGIDQIIGLSVAMFTGKAHETDSFRKWSLKKAIVKNPDRADFQLDGEVVKNTQSVEVICHPRKLKFIC
jgi:diacylglycerol kinase (ATP)